MEKKCSTCKETKPIEEFHNQKSRKDGKQNHCKACSKLNMERWRKNNREHHLEQRRHYRRFNTFNLTKDQYHEMLEKQNHGCDICGNTNGKRSLAVDHCHQAEENGEMKVRGLLCGRCNVSIGSFEDNVDLLKAAINYLQKGEDYE